MVGIKNPIGEEVGNPEYGRPGENPDQAHHHHQELPGRRLAHRKLDRPSGGTVELYINQGKYFSLILDDVMEIQSDLNILSMWSDDAAQQLKITVDRDVLDGIVGKANAANFGATAGAISGNLNLGIKGTPLRRSRRPRPPVRCFCSMPFCVWGNASTS